MSELSDFRVVQDAAELGEPSATNGANGVNGTQSANGYNGTNGHNGANGRSGAHTNEPPARESAGAAEGFMVGAEVVPSGAAQSESSAIFLDMWQADLPQLRIGTASVSHPSAADARPAVAVAAPVRVYDPDARPPHLLRAMRFLFGLILLLGAWLATASVLMLGRGLTDGLPAGMDLPFQIGLYVLTALGSAWLALVALACLAAGPSPSRSRLRPAAGRGLRAPPARTFAASTRASLTDVPLASSISSRCCAGSLICADPCSSPRATCSRADSSASPAIVRARAISTRSRVQSGRLGASSGMGVSSKATVAARPGVRRNASMPSSGIAPRRAARECRGGCRAARGRR